MKLIKIIVDNFASYKHEEIDFNNYGNGPFLLCGENGAGKSTVIEMITVAIFNRCAITDSKGSGLDELITSGEDSFKIDFTFEQNGNEYEIIRERNKKSQKLKFFVNGEQQKGKLTEVQNMINSIVKLSYETFIDSVIIGQNKSSSFMEKSASERKSVFTEILGLDQYEVMESYVKDLKKELNSTIKFNQEKLSKLENIISNKDSFENELNNITFELPDIEKEISKYEKMLEKELSEKAVYEQMKKQQDMIKNRKNQIELKINSVNNNILKGKSILEELNSKVFTNKNYDNEIQTLREEVNNLRKNDREISNKKAEYNSEKNMNENTIKNIKNKGNRLKNYGEAICEFCGQQITEEYKSSHLSELLKQIKELKSKNEDLDNKISNLSNESSTMINDIRIKENKINTLIREKSEFEKIEIKKQNVNDKLNDLNNQLNELLNEKEEFNNVQEIDLEFKTFKDNEYRIKLNSLRNNYNIKSSRISVLNNELERIKNVINEYTLLKQENEDNKILYRRYEELQKAYSKDGIPALIIDSVIPQLEVEINKYLNILSDGKISMMFKTQDTNKSGNTKETLDIIVSDQAGNVRPYNLFSGGQKMRISVAMRIALSKMLATRNNTSIDFFFIDEAMSPLDEAGKSAFLDTINIISTMFPQIFVISHIDDIKEAFSKKLLVTNNPNEGSKIKLVK